MLLCLLGGGYPIPGWRGHPIQSWMGGGYPIPGLDRSTPSSPGQGVPHPVLDGRYPIQSWMGDTPSSPGGVTPSQICMVVPHPSSGWACTPSQVWMGGTPSQVWMGCTPSSPGWGVPPYLDLGQCPSPCLDLGWSTPAWIQDGVPPPFPRNVNRQTPVKTVPSLVLRTRAVMSTRAIPFQNIQYQCQSGSWSSDTFTLPGTGSESSTGNNVSV